jgi:hypothetical protein
MVVLRNGKHSGEAADPETRKATSSLNHKRDRSPDSSDKENANPSSGAPEAGSAELDNSTTGDSRSNQASSKKKKLNSSETTKRRMPGHQKRDKDNAADTNQAQEDHEF